MPILCIDCTLGLIYLRIEHENQSPRVNRLYEKTLPYRLVKLRERKRGKRRYNEIYGNKRLLFVDFQNGSDGFFAEINL